MPTNGEDLDAEPPEGWEEHVQDLANVADPAMRRSLVKIIERDRQQWRQRAIYLVELRSMARAQAARDERIFGELAALHTLAKDTYALASGTAARVARLDGEREVTRAQVKEVHAWAGEIKKAAEASHQREIVTAQRAVEVLAELGDAKIDEARAEAKLEVARGAIQSLTTETTVIRTERRARTWTVKQMVLGALILAGAGGLGTIGKWLFDRLTAGGGGGK